LIRKIRQIRNLFLIQTNPFPTIQLAAAAWAAGQVECLILIYSVGLREKSMLLLLLMLLRIGRNVVIVVSVGFVTREASHPEAQASV